MEESIDGDPHGFTLTSSQKRRSKRKKKRAALAAARMPPTPEEKLCQGSSEEKLGLEGSSEEKLGLLVGSSEEKLDLAGSTEEKLGLRGSTEEKLGLEGSGEEKGWAEDEKEAVSFVTGNPALGESALRVGHVKLTAAPRRPDEACKSAPLRARAAVEPPGNATRLVAVLGVPKRFASSDLISLLQPWRAHVSHLRVARHCEPPEYPSELVLVLVRMTSLEASTELYAGLHGRAFNSFEPERCVLAFVETIVWEQPPSGECGDVLLPMGATLPSCVVCLEKMSDDGGGDQLYTTACDHTFHTHCLERWRDAPCPVCRYDQVGATELASCCDVCGAMLDESPLWVCLLCGHCGCEREHAREHYEQSLHAYAIDVATRHAWDFASEGFVHRLAIQKKGGDDDRQGLGFIQGPAPPRGLLADGRDEDSNDSDDDDSAAAKRLNALRVTTAVRDLKNSKLEGMALEYNELLRTQLARQRDGFEARMAAAEASRAAQHTVAAETAAAFRRECRQLDAKKAKLEAQHKKLEEELQFQLEINKSLEADLVQWEAIVKEAEEELKQAEIDCDAQCRPLEEELERLMLKLDEV